MSVNLYRLPKKGKSPISSKKTRIGTLAEDAKRKLEIAVPTTPGNYLLEVEFRHVGNKKRVGRLGEYFRVLEPTVEAQIVLSASSVRPGETLEACLENFGTGSLAYGEGKQIEVNDGSIWKPSLLDPPGGPSSAIINSLGPGERQPLGSFTVPSGAEIGLYRYRWSADAGLVTLAPEFQIVP